MRTLGIVLAALLCATETQAQTLPPLLADVAFLIGDWHGGGPAQNGIMTHDTSRIHLVAGGTGLLRQEHTDLTDANGKPQGSFDQVMIIYPEGGTLHADYLDGGRTIHYTGATIAPGESVTFQSEASGSTPAFTLTYTKTGADTLSVNFTMHEKGAAGLVLLATGTLTRD